jgi:translation elongation factor EF-1beta
MKTPLYVGQVDENGLHLIQRLPDDAEEARRIVEQMNKDMGTDYKLIGEVPKQEPIEFDLGAEKFGFSCFVRDYTGIVDRIEQSMGSGSLPTMEITLKGYPKL